MEKIAKYLNIKVATKKFIIFEEHQTKLGIVHRFLDNANKFNVAVRQGPSFDTANEAVSKNKDLGKVFVRNTIGSFSKKLEY